MLRGILDRGNASAAYLFVGAPGLGRLEAAHWFGLGLVCDTRGGASKPCEECEACRLGVANHPDVHEVHKTQGRSSLGIEDVRTRVRERLSRRSYTGSRKVVIIPDAHRLTPAAQNALLKTLEDPLGESTVLLLVPGSGYLLPTVRSRCVVVPFRNPGLKAFEEQIPSELPSHQMGAKELFLLSGGDVGAARRILADDEGSKWNQHRQLIDDLSTDVLSPVQMTRWADHLPTDPEEAETTIDSLTLVLRHLADATCVSKRQYAEAVDVLVRAGEMIRSNANRRLTWEICLIKLRDILRETYNISTLD